MTMQVLKMMDILFYKTWQQQKRLRNVSLSTCFSLLNVCEAISCHCLMHRCWSQQLHLKMRALTTAYAMTVKTTESVETATNFVVMLQETIYVNEEDVAY